MKETSYKEHRIYEILQGMHGEPKDFLDEMRKLSPSNRTLRVDADSLLYYVAYSPTYKKEDVIDDGTFIGDKQKTTLKDYKRHLDLLIDEVVTDCELASFRGELPRFNNYELVFTPSTNFRYELFPDYKKSRTKKPQSNMLKRLKKYAKANLGIVPDNAEADDYVYYYAMRGDPVASGDKDVVYSVPSAYYYHSKHKEVINNTPEQMSRWVLLQTLAGDLGDDIPGIKGVGIGTADKLLPLNGTFKDVISIYQEKGYTKEDAILTRRLVGLDQYKRGRVKLWKN